MAVGEDDDEDMAFWRRTWETLLARGAKPSEAIDAANLMLEAHRRKRVEGDAAKNPGTDGGPESSD